MMERRAFRAVLAANKEFSEMTKLFLAASVAVLAISAPAAARPDAGDRVKARESAQKVDRSAQRADRKQVRAQRVERPARADRSIERAARADRSAQRAERQVRTQRVDRAHARVADRPARAQRVERAQNRTVERQAIRADRVDRAQVRDRVQTRIADRQAQRVDRQAQVQDRMIARQDLRAQRVDQRIERNNSGFANLRARALFDGCPPGLAAKNNGCLPPGQAKKLFVGAPLATVAGLTTLNALPSNVSYLYPDTDDYYYRYGDGYVYRVDRSSSLIAALIPLLAGGFMPGQYLPTNYMNSYVPASYGFNSFYADSPYQCNRYVNGIVYQVDCVTGMIEDVVPLYAGGYGVGQMLPSAYYNLPYGYRGLYSDNSDYGYYYAPGAIYQYDQGSSLITSVAALLSPGFGVGQPLPLGYNAYNVPYAYRDTYYDTPNTWYRYNNGNIYQVDPTTLLVTAVVASILT